MPNKQQNNKPIPGDFIGNTAKRLGISLNDEHAECLCYVYALVLTENIGSMLGAVEEKNDKLASNEPKNEQAIQNMIKALEQIYFKFSQFSVGSEIKESCLEYSAFLYEDINYLLPKLKWIITQLKNMARIYSVAKQDLNKYPEQLNFILNASEQYEGYLLECRTCIIAINIRVEWWCKKLSPRGCQGQKAVG